MLESGRSPLPATPSGWWPFSNPSLQAAQRSSSSRFRRSPAQADAVLLAPLVQRWRSGPLPDISSQRLATEIRLVSTGVAGSSCADLVDLAQLGLPLRAPRTTWLLGHGAGDVNSLCRTGCRSSGPKKKRRMATPPPWPHTAAFSPRPASGSFQACWAAASGCRSQTQPPGKVGGAAGMVRRAAPPANDN